MARIKDKAHSPLNTHEDSLRTSTACIEKWMKINILKMVQENFQATWLMAGFFNFSLNN